LLLLVGSIHTYSIFIYYHIFVLNYNFICIGRNVTHNILNTIDLIDIKDRNSYTVITDFVPENFALTPTPSKKPDINIILVSVLCAAGFLITVGSFFILRRRQGRFSVHFIPTPGENDE
jgi:hypothetical protein